MHVACQNDGEHDDHDEDQGENGQSGENAYFSAGGVFPGDSPFMPATTRPQ